MNNVGQTQPHVRAYQAVDRQAVGELWRVVFPDAPMRAVEAGLAERGCDKVNLQVRVGNEQVISFYEKLGYDVEERVSMGKRIKRV